MGINLVIPTWRVTKKRIYEQVLKDHFERNRQAAFICDPRQIGKTTLAQHYADLQPVS